MTESGEWRVENGEWRVMSGEFGDSRWLIAVLTDDTQTTGSHAEQSEQAHKLLRRLVGFNCKVEHDEAGAPYLPELPDTKVSVSHCRKAVAAAVSKGKDIGIDIENRRNIGTGLMQRVCTSAELARIEAAIDPDMAFLQLWTRKEAVLKCRRTGIRGFDSMVEALADTTVNVQDIDCNVHGIVAAIAF